MTLYPDFPFGAEAHASEDVDWNDYAPEEKELFDNWLANNGEIGENMADYIFNGLCRRGVIPPGDYQIYVS